jgi:hypothetical protein
MIVTSLPCDSWFTGAIGFSWHNGGAIVAWLLNIVAIMVIMDLVKPNFVFSVARSIRVYLVGLWL